jgi:hypothetical protein
MLIEEILEIPLQIQKILDLRQKFPVTITHVIVLLAASVISQIDLSQTSLSIFMIKLRVQHISLS